MADAFVDDSVFEVVTGVATAGATLAARYESLIRLAEAIRSRTVSDDLFGVLVDELRRVVPFDAIAQFDATSAQVHWRYERPSGETCPLQAADETESVAW